MEKIFKNTTLFFMLIAGLVVFSHSVVPHDHHYNLADDLADEQQNDEERVPIHCHFLDYVTVDQTIQKTAVQKIVQQPVLFVVLSGFTFEEKSNTQTYFLKSDHKSDLSTFIKASPTRGSPYFC